MDYRRAQVKRKAEGDLNDDRLTKRLESLKLGLSTLELCLLESSAANNLTVEAQAKTRPQLYAHIQRRPSAPIVAQPAQDAPQLVQDEDDMAVDETKHRVYISNLEKEIAEIEAAEEAAKKTIFMPDVAKRLHDQRIPHSIYANKDGDIGGINRDQALVLYDLPKSLTVDESKDSVRRAFIDARHRAQEKQRMVTGLPPSQSMPQSQLALPAPSADAGLELDDGDEPMALDEDEDDDVMEID